MTYEIVFSRRCFPPSRTIKAERYEIRPSVIGEGDQIVFYSGDYVVGKESVYDVKEIKIVEQS